MDEQQNFVRSDADQSHEDIWVGFQPCTRHPALDDIQDTCQHIKPLCGAAAVEIKKAEPQPVQQANPAAPRHPAPRPDVSDEAAVPLLSDMTQEADTSSVFLGF